MGGTVAVELTFPAFYINSEHSSDMQEVKRIARQIATHPLVIGGKFQKIRVFRRTTSIQYRKEHFNIVGKES